MWFDTEDRHHERVTSARINTMSVPESRGLEVEGASLRTVLRAWARSLFEPLHVQEPDCW